MGRRLRAGVVYGGLALALLAAACTEHPAAEPDDAPAMLARPDSVCPAGSAVSPAGESEFGRTLVREISAKAFYPQEAFDGGQQGRVVLCLHYLADGHLDRALVQDSSGYPALDGAALYATGLYAAEQGDTPMPPGTRPNPDRASQPRRFPPLPASLLAGRDNLWLSVPVAFTPANPAEMAAKTRPENAWKPDARHCSDPPATGEPTESAANPSADHAAGAGAAAPILADFVDRYRRNIFFPKAAINLRIEGRAELRFVVENGRFRCGALSRSSGSALFDGVALLGLAYTVLDPAQVREFREITQPRAVVVLPINFKNRH